MADVTGGTPPTNASPFAVPDDIKAVYDHFGSQAFFSAANAASLPTASSHDGRTLTADDTLLQYTSDGSSWRVTGGPGARLVLGEAARLASATAYWLGTGFADIPDVTIAVTAPSGVIRITAQAMMTNDASGVTNLTAQLRVTCDGSAVGEALTGIFLPQPSSGAGGHTEIFTVTHTPGSGAHTYKLQGLSPSTPAVKILQARITVEKIG